MEPPPCIQNAMLTKDKKPFTYTPGGLNLNEIRSPRMARRIERNAAYEGVGPTPAQQNRPHVASASLPPSALAAMQPQMHVQVFPTGPPPPPPMNHSRGGVPPPPPPMSNIPPPPPPPTQPLPTQKVRTSDQQIVERPDMTKIIPENPMGLLKKTGGPKIRNTLLEEMYRNPEGAVPQQVSMNRNSTQQHPSSPHPQQVRSPPIQQVRSPPPQQARSPPLESIPYQQQQRSVQTPLQQAWSPPIIERKESPRTSNQQPTYPQQPERNVNIGCIYIPPMNPQQNKNVTSPPPAPQSPKVQTPGTPALKDAPKPWQQKQQDKQEEAPRWTIREPSSSTTAVPQEQYIPQSAPSHQQNSPRWPQNNQSPNIQQQRPQDPRTTKPQQMQQGPPERREVYTQRILQPQFDPTSNPNAVFVSQPIILQHPGAHYGPPIITRRENVQQEGGVRTIPIQIEGRETANDNRNLNRQQSGSSNPSQSGSFRVIQKITGTDGEEVDFNGAGEHTARYPQQFPAEQMRKMQLGDTDQQLLNRFKQVPSDAALNKPQVRNIPIQIEGNGEPKNSNYVPPSQQVPAEEPKKYTGSSIPSRSFRMLQAMTAPDSCANVKEANETNENYDFPYQGNNWGFPPAYPMYNPQPFWPPYYSPVPFKFPSTEHSNSDPELNRASTSKTPQPYFGYSPCTPTKEMEQKSVSRTPSSFSRCSSSTELENINWRQTPIPYPMYPSPTTPVPGRRTPRKNMNDSDESDSNTCTPVPFWYGYPPPDSQEKLENPPPECNYSYYPPYSPYYDPYYFPYYYYGYPPMFSPLPFMRPGSDPEDLNGYSSMDEMSHYTQRNHDRSTKPSDSNPHISNTSPEIVVTPTPENDPDTQYEHSSSESDTDTETNHVEREPLQNSCKIQTIRSVPDINVYKQSDDESELSEVDDESDASSNSSLYDEGREEEVVPHQLSIIFEVSEVTDTPRLARESSVFSDCTTIGGMRSDDEDDEDSMSKQWISDNLMEIASRIQNRINARIELDDSELFTSFTVKSSSSKKDIVANKDGRKHQHQEDSISANIDNDQTKSITCGSSTENNDDSHNQENEYEEYHYKETNAMYHNAEEKYEDSHSKCRENVKEIPRSENDCQKELCEEISKALNEHQSDDKDVEETPSKESSDSEDWWGVIGKNEDDFPPRKSNLYYRDTDVEPQNVAPEGEASITIDTANIVENYPQNDLEVINDEIRGETLPGDEYLPEKETLPKDTYEENDVFYIEEVEQGTGPKLEITSGDFPEEEVSITFDSANVEENHSQNDMDVINDEIKGENFREEEYPPEKEALPKDAYEESDLFYTEEVKQATVPKLEITSAHSSHSSASSRKVSSEQSDDSSESEDSDSSEDEEEGNKHDMNNNVPNDEEETIVIPSIKDRIRALQECITVKKKSHKIEEEIRISVKNQVESIDSGEVNKSKPISAKSSVKSFDEISEEDSGVTDLSKQYSDNEEFPELRKMSKYQRASTHSRLFQLLQEECENEEDQTDLENRKNQLSLPLNSNVSDQLAEELVHSMLKQKKGQIFRNMSVDKLHAAAKKVLQEDGDSCDTPSEGYSDYLSPLRNDTGNSTPQEFYGHYNEYVQYYDSWAQAAALQESEIIQSNTFRMIQDLGQKTNGCPAILAKCPRVLSGKNVHSDLKKLVESPEESSINIPDPKS